jgi:hypothetical protein
MKSKYKIIQRKPDVREDESSYSTAIVSYKFPYFEYPIVGYGFTQEQADTNAIEKIKE